MRSVGNEIINPDKHLNRSGLHLNHLGTPILIVNFLNVLNRLETEQWLKSKGSKNSGKNSGKSEALNEVTYLRQKFTKNLFFGHLNVNSVRNKFEALQFLIKDKFDVVFLVSESKLDLSFPGNQFKIPGYRIFRQDRDKYGGGLMFYINQSIPCKKIETFQFTSSIEILTLEINLGKEKLLIFGTYKPLNINNSSFLNELYNAITFNSTLYKNYVLFGDLNIVQDNTQLQNFCESFLFEHLIKKPTCYKGDTPTGIDHIITNIPEHFMKSMALETSISDHHKMIMTIFLLNLRKVNPKLFNIAAIKSSI